MRLSSPPADATDAVADAEPAAAAAVEPDAEAESGLRSGGEWRGGGKAMEMGPKKKTKHQNGRNCCGLNILDRSWGNPRVKTCQQS